MEFGKRHDTTDTTDFFPAPTCYGLVTDLLRGSYVWETDVMDFGVYSFLEHVISELRGVTCHMRSHSVTFHATQVNTPRLNPSQTGR